MDMVETMERDRRTQSNVLAYTHAVGWTGLFNGFAGKDGKRSLPQEMLPYPDEVESGSKRSISKRTAEIFVALRSSGVLPLKIVSATSHLFEDIARLTNDH